MNYLEWLLTETFDTFRCVDYELVRILTTDSKDSDIEIPENEVDEYRKSEK